MIETNSASKLFNKRLCIGRTFLMRPSYITLMIYDHLRLSKDPADDTIRYYLMLIC